MPSWTNVLQRASIPKLEESISSRVFGDAKSSKGISVAVVDANAIIHGDKLTGTADKFVTVSEVIDEVRDPVSRQRLAFLPLHIDTMDPSPQAIKKVVKFARETGDLQTLSEVDLRVIALAYTLESQIHGAQHLREKPPPLRMVNMKHLSEPEMPGWGKNISNLADWEALETMAEGDNVNIDSKILPLKNISFKDVPTNGTFSNTSVKQNIVTSGIVDGQENMSKRYNQKKEISIESKIIVDGIDASQGEYDNNPDDWKPAVSRSTHKRYLRRKKRSEMLEVSENLDHTNEEIPSNASISRNSDVHTDGGSVDESETPSSQSYFIDSTMGNASLTDPDISVEGDGIDMCVKELDQLEISSETDASIDLSHTDDANSEQSLSVRSLSDSTVACVTSDFAMQNVILQIGLRLLVPGGMQIRKLHRWVLKCHACNKVTSEIGRIFCSNCGNGGTLRKVSVTVGENGIVLASRCPRINLRGTKFSLPMPQGGRQGVAKNVILREDQIPRKYLVHPTKKKNSKLEKDFFVADDIFSHCDEKKVGVKPPVGKAISVFTGKRNPNDNHFSRRKV
ncbi:putative RNA-binding protein nob1 [Zostera marina]|uniref:Putative RNA-binding protein nob1 n=1 Tax=Zostera marina TaxID=29655 RepID=A0A0K9PYH3_ZOSMR|nr:putative RNA-binding protein nob1 [Zostera marina]